MDEYIQRIIETKKDRITLVVNCLMDFQVSGGRDKGRATDRVDARKTAKKSPCSLSPS